MPLAQNNVAKCFHWNWPLVYFATSKHHFIASTNCVCLHNLRQNSYKISCTTISCIHKRLHWLQRTNGTFPNTKWYNRIQNLLTLFVWQMKITSIFRSFRSRKSLEIAVTTTPNCRDNGAFGSLNAMHNSFWNILDFSRTSAITGQNTE